MVCSWIAQTLLCIKSTQVLDRNDWVMVSNEVAVEEQKVTAKQVDGALLWATPDGQKVWGAHAVAELFEDFILLRWSSGLLRLGISERAYNAFAVRRHRVSQFFGMGVCGIKRTPEPFETEAPSRFAYERTLYRLGRLGLLYVGVCFVIQVLAQNRAVPESIKPRPPFFVELLVEYAHFYQGWGMFAVSPRTDSTVVVRAYTVDGRLVDPLGACIAALASGRIGDHRPSRSQRILLRLPVAHCRRPRVSRPAARMDPRVPETHRKSERHDCAVSDRAAE